MSSGVGYRHGSDPELLWLWCRWAAVALIQPLVWQLLYAMDVALKAKKEKKEKKKKPISLSELVSSKMIITAATLSFTVCYFVWVMPGGMDCCLGLHLMSFL